MTQGAPVRILLVEDNAGDARLLRETLRDAQSMDFHLVHAETLRQGVEAVTGKGCDVVLLDLSLPDAHGLETVGRMLAAAPTLPIIVLTGLGDETIAVHAVHAGAQDYLVKGTVEGGTLGRAIRYAIERKRLEGERAQLLRNEQEARASAEAAVRARDDVLRVVAHDIGNSLSAVKIHAMVLERTLGATQPRTRRGSAPGPSATSRSRWIACARTCWTSQRSRRDGCRSSPRQWWCRTWSARFPRPPWRRR